MTKNSFFNNRIFTIVAKISCCSALLLLMLLFNNPVSQAQTIDGRWKLAPNQVVPKAKSKDRVKVVELLSITCGHCYNFFKAEDKFLKTFQGKVDFSYIEVGWIGENLSRFFYLSILQNKRSEASGLLFRAFHEGGITDLNNPDKLKIFARELKMGDDFLMKMKEKEVQNMLIRGITYKTKYAIKSTPAFIVEDALIIEGNDQDSLAKVINSLLKEPVNYP